MAEISSVETNSKASPVSQVKRGGGKVLIGGYRQPITDPNVIYPILDEISNGGSILDFCEKQNVNYSEVWAYIMASKERLDAYNAALAIRGDWYVQRLVNELKAVGLVDIKGAFNADGRLKAIDEIPEAIRRVISGIEVVETFEMRPGPDGMERVWTGYVKKIKMNEKLKAIEMLGKHVKMFVEEIKHTGTVEVKHTVPQFDLDSRLEQLRKRKSPEQVVEAQVVSKGD